MTQASEARMSARWRGISGNDLAAGLLCLAIAATALFNVSNLRFGTVMRMGPGFTPTVLSWLLAGFGVALIIVALVRGSEKMEAWRIRPMLAIGAAIVLFSVGMQQLGLFATTFVTTLVGGLATSDSRWHEVLIMALVLGAACHLLFIVGLGMPLRSVPVFL